MATNHDPTFDVSWMPFLRSCPDMAHSDNWDPEGFVSPFQSTPAAEQVAIINDINLTSSDTFLDLGCGEGTILIECAKRFGCKSIGIELDADLCAKARAASEEASVAHLVEIINCDFTQPQVEQIMGRASVIFIYLIPSAISLLSAKLAAWLDDRSQDTQNSPILSAQPQRRTLVSFLWRVSELDAYEIPIGSPLEGACDHEAPRRHYFYAPPPAASSLSTALNNCITF